MLTTGTTGPARGVDRGAVRLVQGLPVATLVARLPVRRGEPLMVLPPLFHGFGLGLLSLGLAVGAPVVLTRRFEPERVWDVVAAEGVRTLVVVPPMLAELVDDPRAGDRAVALRAVVTGAGPLHPDLAVRSRRVLGEVLHNLYGSTEHGWATLADPEALAEAPGTVGRPPLGVRVQVRTADGRRAEPGEEGRVWVGGVLDLTSRRGLSDTGDLGYLDRAGRLFVTGRVDDVVVTGGENVWTGEVVAALRAHPDVADAAVTGDTDERYGTRLVARVVLASGSTARPEDLQAHLRELLPPAARPRELRLVESLDVPEEPRG